MAESEQLLQAIARFLDQELRPVVTDPGLAFRTRVAASLLRSLALEAPAAQRLDAEARAGLGALLGSDASRAELEADLVERLRAGRLDAKAQAAARTAVRTALRARLKVTSPELDLEEPGK
jgi:hypothetical protein